MIPVPFSLVGDVLLFAITAVMWTFVALYGLFARWEATPAGRNLLSITVATALVLTLGCVQVLTGPHPFHTIARAVLYGVVLLVLIRLLALYVRTQCTGRHHSKE
ncbi:hypothetical protein [Nocardiopsis sp. FR26]|uniref:putative phage holin n=1 Tax=Nocardiopsis sp. FR26 TaxID=2605987 RepID=UPI00135926D5|nr:hypothetical protein [Nocardiopsis sp. FR26]